MPTFSNRLARMRSRANAILTDTCQIEHATHTPSPAGGINATWTTRGTAIACYLVAKSATTDLTASGGRLESFTTYTLHLKHDGTIEPGDRVTLDGRVYRAESVIEPDTLRATLAAKLTLEDV